MQPLETSSDYAKELEYNGSWEVHRALNSVVSKVEAHLREPERLRWRSDLHPDD
jgi:hypothetical protein